MILKTVGLSLQYHYKVLHSRLYNRTKVYYTRDFTVLLKDILYLKKSVINIRDIPVLQIYIFGK